jgi:hypothetical protein
MPIAPVGAAPPAPVSPAAAPRPSFAAVLESRATLRHASSAAQTSTSPAVTALAHVERAQARLDGVLAAARAGRTFTAAELIALQGEAYRCAQTVDLASKLVEQGAQAVKQALNTPL